MLFRELPEGRALALSQLTHAWVAAELMRAWADPQEEEVLLGAMHHDIGWLAWEQSPTLDSERGRPCDYRRISTGEHVAVWSAAAPLALAYGRVAAWLTSRHGTRLYERHDYEQDGAEDAAAARAFVQREEARQEHLLTAIAADPALAPRFTRAALAQASLLINSCDRISLALCHGVSRATSLDDILVHGQLVTVTLTPVADAISVAPWPFMADEWTVTVDGRILDSSLTSSEEVQRWLAEAEWESATIRMVPASE